MDNEQISILDRYGENYTEKEYITNPAIGRDNEIKELLLVLLTPEKSAILIGKPGVGKTAIVEGLAYRIINNDVPDLLKGYSIINVKTASLLGTLPNGESKLSVMIEELKQKDKIILFIDEIHMLIGATDTSAVDFANIFKEGLGRGSIKVVGATTSEEYERYILRDKAFTRRFQKIEVKEPTRDETVAIMMGTLPKIEKTTGVTLKYTNYIKELIMGFLVDLTSEYKRVFEIGSRYPDVSLTLLKQAFSYAIFDNMKEVNIFHIQKAIENTKSVYPDVIKKEIPKFLTQFKDIINEEKGIDVGWDKEKKEEEIPGVKKVEGIPSYEDYKENLKLINEKVFERNKVVPSHENHQIVDSQIVEEEKPTPSSEYVEIDNLLNAKPVSINPDEEPRKVSIPLDIDLNLDNDTDDDKLDDDDFFE